MFNRLKNRKQLLIEFEDMSSFLFDCMFRCIMYDLDEVDYVYEIDNIASCVIHAKVLSEERFCYRPTTYETNRYLFKGFPETVCESRIICLFKLRNSGKAYLHLKNEQFLDFCNCYKSLSNFIETYVSTDFKLEDNLLKEKIISVIDTYRCKGSFI